MKLIERKQYLKRLQNVLDTPDIKVLTGVRRSGKSKLMNAFEDWLKSNIADANIIHINFNLHQFDELKESQKLYSYVTDHYQPGRKNYVLIDEIQNCSGFEKAVNWLHEEEKYDLYITGSNAFLLSSDLATLFTGRTFKIEVYPFSFAEYMAYYPLEDKEAAFDRYLLEGGMSGSYVYKEQEDRMGYIADVFNTLIVRDIRQKYKIRNPQLMDEIVDFLMDNISNLSSARNIANALNHEKTEINHKTVGNYLEYLCNAYAFYPVMRYDIRGKRYLKSSRKYYLSDHSFRYARLGTRNMDYGRTMENMIAIELLRRGYETYAGVLYKKEIDFVAIRQSEKLYIQVADDIGNPDTFQREAAPLLQIRDAYPKIILARTKHPSTQYEGIQIINIADWLLDNTVSQK